MRIGGGSPPGLGHWAAGAGVRVMGGPRVEVNVGSGVAVGDGVDISVGEAEIGVGVDVERIMAVLVGAAIVFVGKETVLDGKRSGEDVGCP